MNPIQFTKPRHDQDFATMKANWEAARDFLIALVLAAGFTPDKVEDGTGGAFGKWAEVTVEIMEADVRIGTLCSYEDLVESGIGPQCSHFEVEDGNGVVWNNGKDLIYESPQEVIDDLKNDLVGYVPVW